MNDLLRHLRNALVLLALLVPAAAWPLSSGLVISQVYGGGGSPGAPYTNDFIELHNNSGVPMSVTGMAVQYASAVGSSWLVVPLSGVLPAGAYYLIQGSSSGANGALLPTPEVSNPMLNLSNSAGKVALTSDTTALTGTCPLGSVIDFVGYGGNPMTTNCFEGSGPAGLISPLVAAIRNSGGCIETDNNGTDFTVAAPTPRNSSIASDFACAEFTMNETDDRSEANFCNVQFPSTITATAGVPTAPVYVQLYHAGVTESMGAGSWTAQIGYGPQMVSPATSPGSFTWVAAAFNTDVMSNDEFQATFTPVADGTFRYAARFSPDGLRWTYCDLNGAGSNMGLTFEVNQLGTMTVGGGSATVPGAPMILSATGLHGAASVSFIAPPDGGSPITSYTVTSDPGGITGTGAASPITVSGLTNGTAYTFTVTATNAVGTGLPSSPSNSVTPTALTDLVISQVYGGGGLTNAPYLNDFIELHNNSAAPISLAGMAVQYASGSGSTWQVSALSGSIQPGAYYLIQGATGGAVGIPLPTPDTGMMINMSSTIGKVALTSSTVALTGTCPLGGGVIDFVGYGNTMVTNCWEGASPAGFLSAPTAAIRISNGCIDTNNNNSDFDVFGAPNPRNSASPAVPCGTVPGAPFIGSATAGNAQATVSFMQPVSNGGSAITSYTVTANPGGITASGPTSPITVVMLNNGTAYTFTVTATNAIGTGAASAASNSVTPTSPATAPGAPLMGSATAGNAQATVTFMPPVSNGGSPITSFTVTSSPGGIAASGGSSPITVTGLANGTPYTFTVTATNAIGTGAASAASNSVTPTAPATAPGAPTGVSAAAGNALATVSFTAPASNGGSAITSYTVTSSPGGITATAAGSPITVANLVNGTPYTFTVTATNAIGTGPASAASNSVTPTDPNPPRLGNISTRMQVLTGNDVMIGGFVIGGSTNKRVAIVATGPSLAPFGITNALPNPTLRLVRSSDQAVLATNDDWQSAANQANLTAAGLAPSNSLEAAILIDLAPGAYTAIVEGASGVTGVSVIGVYEVNSPETPLINISTRGRVLTGNDVMIGGFVITGSAAQTVAIVATGPSLAAFGITSPLANPTISLVRSSDQAVLATNDDWQADANASQLQAAGFAPSISFESGLYRTLAPGAYTVIVQGVGGGTGVAVIGVYKVN